MMDKYLALFIIFLLSVFSTTAFAQSRIEGKVINQDSIGLFSSLILLKNQNTIIDYTFSDFDGKFNISQEYKKGMFIEVHLLDFSDTIKIDSSFTNLLIEINIQGKITKEELLKWRDNVFKKYNLEYKEE